ncbi:rho GDP dissociation inhibitor [Vermiconidia calcicola]|uniref:Rho GDP dissociation inhibitor n=1 Tax=Vermiconidia calcicola TaxID=1690605 RepID=A0ACC3MA43_9PEZI|nr:rho GDP dissociation inhibitor [Vermiconidia calcicola]
MSTPRPEDLEPETTEGFKLGEKKTIEEYNKLDANDESLKKWKESLGLGSGDDLSDPKDPRKVIIFSLGLEVEGRSDIIIDLTKPGALEDLNKQPFTIKEGATFRMKARFKVQHQILSGLKYVQVVSRMGVKNKMQEMIGSYSPNTSDKREYEKKFESETAPSGMIGRGHYEAVSKFIDDDNQTHLQFKWSFDIKKDWQ